MALYSFYKDKVVLISGGTSGLGKALVLQLLQLGCRVSTFGRDNQKMDAITKQGNGKNLLVRCADIRSKEDCKVIVNETIEVFGRIDILINNAGVSMKKTLQEVDLDYFENIIQTNIMGAVYLTRYALAHIIQSKGIVSSISSVAGLRGLPGRTGYCASKFALHGFMESLRVEMKAFGVQVLWFSPGFFSSNIRTRLQQNQTTGKNMINEEHILSSDQCASIIISKIQKHRRHTIITFLGKITHLFNRIYPSYLDRIIYKKYYNHQGNLIR